MRRTKQIGLLLGVGFVIVLSTLILCSKPSEPELLRLGDSLPVTQVLASETRRGFDALAWFSTNALIAVASAEKGRYEVSVRDWPTKRAIGIAKKTGLLQVPGPGYALSFWAVSPDKKRLLMVLFPGGDDLDSVFVVHELDGSGSAKRSGDWGWCDDSVFWLSDSRSWVDIQKQKGSLVARVFTLNSDVIKTVPLGLGAAYVVTGRAGSALLAVDGTTLSGSTNVSLATVEFSAGSNRVHPFGVSLPGDRVCENVIPSPDGHLLLWELSSINRYRPLVERKDSFPYFGLFPSETKSLWISRSDGNGMVEVGRLPPNVDFSDLDWLPDARAVSFSDWHTIWKVPIPKAALQEVLEAQFPASR